MGKLVKAKLLQGWLVAVPIEAAVMAVSTILVPQNTIIPLLTNITWGSLRTVANVALLLGLALMIPSFSEESRARTSNIMINLQTAVFTSIGLEIGFNRLGLSLRKMFADLDRFMGLLYDHLVQTAIISLLGIVLLTLGRKKLSIIEYRNCSTMSARYCFMRSWVEE